MRHFLWLFLVALCMFGLLVNTVEAKRFGGGRNVGIQRSVNTSRLGNLNDANPIKAAGNSRWLAPLMGLAAGGLLASLFMHNGLGSGLLMWIALGGLVLLIVSLFRNRTQLATKPNYPEVDNQSFFQNQQNTAATDFDSISFLRDAKAQFIRLQTAYDQSNLDDLRSFTSPEVFAEIQLQLQERGAVQNQTEVTTLNAELLEIDGEIASVRFTGLIKEDPNHPAALLDEIWHFQRPQNAGKWTVAGIQQN